MATVSIADSWFTDPRRGRFLRLLKPADPRLVDGIMVEMWRQGQEAEAKGFELHPNIFDPFELECAIACQLAEIRDGCVYIKGSKDASQYRRMRSEIGRAGGIASGQSRQSSQNDSEQNDKPSQNKEQNIAPQNTAPQRREINNLTEANSTKAKQNEPFSFSSSSSFLEERRTHENDTRHSVERFDAKIRNALPPEDVKLMRKIPQIEGALKVLDSVQGEPLVVLREILGSERGAKLALASRKEIGAIGINEQKREFKILSILKKHLVEIDAKAKLGARAPAKAPDAPKQSEKSTLTRADILSQLPPNLRPNGAKDGNS